MKVAIHQRVGSFSDRWIEYCKNNNITFKIVDAYQNDIIQQISDCDIFMWHFHQNNSKDFLFAKQLIFSIEAMGKSVFPPTNMVWHFDDKVAQKYLLEAIKAPLVPSYVFYSKKKVLRWIEGIKLPIVFKLRGGAGSQNVKLLKSKKEVKRYVNKAFGKGFSQYDARGILKDIFQKYKNGLNTLTDVSHGLIRLGYPTKYAKVKGRDRGYIYFQKFIPNNDSDTRVIVIGKRAFAVKRMVRGGDFRASGSGVKKYDKSEIDERTVKISFDISRKLNFDCTSYDFIFDENKDPLLVEISYGFAIEFYDPCPGYWDDQLKWNEGKFIPQEWMVENLISNFKSRS